MLTPVIIEWQTPPLRVRRTDNARDNLPSATTHRVRDHHPEFTSFPNIPNPRATRLPP
jgi:hypothetical protein